jgi:hypothetical protein
MITDAEQQKRNVEKINSALDHIKVLGQIFNRNDSDELMEQLDAVIREVKEVQHRLTCDDCSGENA